MFSYGFSTRVYQKLCRQNFITIDLKKMHIFDPKYIAIALFIFQNNPLVLIVENSWLLKIYKGKQPQTNKS